MTYEAYSFFTYQDIIEITKSNLPEDLRMSLVKRFFKKSSQKDKDSESVASKDSLGKTEPLLSASFSPVICGEENASFKDEKIAEEIYDDLQSKLDKSTRSFNSYARKYRRHEDALQRLQNDVIAMDSEVKEVLRLTAISKKQIEALDEDILNKKCELCFLKSEVPEDVEKEIRKREPMYFKKYNNLKSSAEARNLLTMIRQRQRALQHLELLVYNKYTDFHYSLKSEAVKKRTSHMIKDKDHSFGHFLSILRSRVDDQEPTADTVPVTLSVECPPPILTTTIVTTASIPTPPTPPVPPMPPNPPAHNSTSILSPLLFSGPVLESNI